MAAGKVRGQCKSDEILQEVMARFLDLSAVQPTQLQDGGRFQAPPAGSGQANGRAGCRRLQADSDRQQGLEGCQGLQDCRQRASKRRSLAPADVEDLG